MISNDDLTFTETLKVLVIEDDEVLGQALCEALEQSGMRAALAVNGVEGLALKRSISPDIVLVDLHLPDTDGIGLVSLLAKHGDCGVIIVSGLTDEADRIVGLELGADDYVCKPPHPRELLARIRSVHRRVKMRAAGKTDPAGLTHQLGKITIDLKARLVRSADGKYIKLTGAEFTALETMLAANGQPVSRDRLSEAALHHPWHAEDRGVDQLIFNLRQKLSDGGDGQQLIRSIRGAGYMVVATEETVETRLANA
jgi:two-component system, OmpR family, response regulator